MGLSDAKATLRRRARARRARQIAAGGPALAEALREAGLRLLRAPPGATVAGYHPLPGELDPLPLLRALGERGHPLALPVVVGRGEPLIFRRWAPGDPLVRGVYSVLEPAADAAVATPDLILTPLLLWDREGRRLGYGGGYYDRTFRVRPSARRIGLALRSQEVPEVPSGPWDVALHGVLCEEGLIEVGGQPPRLSSSQAPWISTHR